MTAPRHPKASMRQARGQDEPPAAVAVQDWGELLERLPRSVVIASLQAALSFHEPERSSFHGGHVCQCRDKGGQRYLWPCPEVRAVIAVLSGEA